MVVIFPFIMAIRGSVDLESLLRSDDFSLLLLDSLQQQFLEGGIETGFSYLVSRRHKPFFSEVILGEDDSIVLDFENNLPSSMRDVLDPYHPDDFLFSLLNLHTHLSYFSFGGSYNGLLFPSALVSSGGDLRVLYELNRKVPSFQHVELVAMAYATRPWEVGVLCLQEASSARSLSWDRFVSSLAPLEASFSVQDALTHSLPLPMVHQLNEDVASRLTHSGLYKAAYFVFQDSSFLDTRAAKDFSLSYDLQDLSFLSSV